MKFEMIQNNMNVHIKYIVPEDTVHRLKMSSEFPTINSRLPSHEPVQFQKEYLNSISMFYIQVFYASYPRVEAIMADKVHGGYHLNSAASFCPLVGIDHV